MAKVIQKTLQIVGIVGALACLAIFVIRPSFPTPDKLIVFLFFIFLIFHQATEMIKRLGPFVILILVYESFRGVANSLNSHVNYLLAPHVDKFLFGSLPTSDLQRWLWHGHVRWFDFVFYIPYLLFFVLPLSLAVLVWKTRDKYYWRLITTYLTVFFAAFLTFLILPAAPPWLASQNHYIQPITRISSNVWDALGIHNFPSVYNHIAANPVAAIPSLHAAVATLFSLFIFKLYGRRWGSLSLVYPALIYVGVVYQGEHYVFDVIAGIIYAVAAYVLVPKAMDLFKRADHRHLPAKKPGKNE